MENNERMKNAERCHNGLTKAYTINKNTIILA